MNLRRDFISCGSTLGIMSSRFWPSTKLPYNIALKVSELDASICLCAGIFSDGEPASPPATMITSDNSSENKICERLLVTVFEFSIL